MKTLKIRCSDKTMEVQATRIIEQYGFKFFIHRPYKRAHCIISEYKTGLRASSGKTIKDAMANLDECVRNRGGVEFFQKMLDQGIQKYGIINDVNNNATE